MIRIFDISLSLISLIFLSPLLIAISITLKFSGEGEILYFQKRVGKGGNIFELVKFATMLRDSPNIGTGNLTINNDPRVLQFGRFLRKTKLNELPQLFNVLVGNMSIVGPRPLTSDTFSMYAKSTQKAILEVKPGLSGIGSLIFRNEELLVLGNKNPREFYAQKISPYKGELELWYINNQSIRMYFRVIFLTLLVVFGCNQKIIYSMLVGLPKPTLEIKEALRSLR